MSCLALRQRNSIGCLYGSGNRTAVSDGGHGLEVAYDSVWACVLSNQNKLFIIRTQNNNERKSAVGWRQDILLIYTNRRTQLNLLHVILTFFHLWTLIYLQCKYCISPTKLHFEQTAFSVMTKLCSTFHGLFAGLCLVSFLCKQTAFISKKRQEPKSNILFVRHWQEIGQIWWV